MIDFYTKGKNVFQEKNTIYCCFLVNQHYLLYHLKLLFHSGIGGKTLAFSMIRVDNEGKVDPDFDEALEKSELATETKKIPASLLEERFQALENSISEIKKAIDKQNMVEEIARLTNKIEILQNIMMNEIPPEGIEERRKSMHIMEKMIGPLAESQP